MGIRLSYEHCRKQDRGQGQRNRANQHLEGAYYDPTGKTLLVTAPAMAPSGRQDHQPVSLIFAPLALQHRQPLAGPNDLDCTSAGAAKRGGAFKMVTGAPKVSSGIQKRFFSMTPPSRTP
jgi:hypothetical protein